MKKSLSLILVFIFIWSVCSTNIVLAAANERESNDSRATATLINEFQTDGTLSSYDTDWFEMLTDTAGYLTIRVDASNYGASISLYNASGSQLQTSSFSANSHGNINAVIVQMPTTTGSTYYLKITNSKSTSISYSIAAVGIDTTVVHNSGSDTSNKDETNVTDINAGTLPSNAIQLTDNNWQTKVWTSKNYSTDCYNKFTIPKDGYVTLTVSKYMVNSGKMCNYDFRIYKQDNTILWSHQVENENPFEEYCTYKIGLSAGTYYLKINPDYFYYTSSYDSEVSYKYKFTASEYWEKEPNNSASKANIIKLNDFYYGVYGESNDDSDCYKIELQKGVEYRMYIKNAQELEDSTTTIMRLYDPSGNTVSGTTSVIYLGYGKINGDCEYYDFIASNSGWYCLELDNASNRAGVQYAVKFQALPVPASKLTFSLSANSYTYDGKVKTPAVIVKDGNGKKISASNYTVSYSNSRINAGTYKVTVTMKGNYSGSKTLTFKINPAKISYYKLSATAYTYDGKVKKPTVTIKNSNGTKLTTSSYTVTYASGCKNAGTYKVTVKMKGNYTGTKTLTFKINPQSLSKGKFSLSATSYTYNGGVKTPTVTVKNAAGAKLTKNTHYTVTYASGRKNIGSYKVTIKSKGNYTGTKTLTFKINPAKTTVSKLTAGKKSVTVAITKKSTQVTGYQIQYSTSKTFSKATTKTISSYKTTKYTLKSLSAKKTYYVRVRTYKKVGKTKYYSGWSTYKYVKTK